MARTNTATTRKDGTRVESSGTGIVKLTSLTGMIRYSATVENYVNGERRPITQRFRTKKEAEGWQIGHRSDKNKGIFIAPNQMTIRDLYALWMDSLTTRSRPLKARTMDGYRYTVERDILPHVGATPIQAFKLPAVIALDKALRDRNASNDKIHRVHMRLSQMIDLAVAAEYVPKNPMPKQQRVGHEGDDEDAFTVLTADQVRRFLTVANGKQPDARGRAHYVTLYNPLWLLYLQTGLRRGEALGLRWGDIDLERGVLHVRQCVEVLRSRPSITSPKTKKAYRTIGMFPDSLNALREHRKVQLARRLAAATWQDADLVFTNGTGGPLNPDHVYDSLQRIIAAANRAATYEGEKLPAFRIHDLRHTHCSHLLAAKELSIVQIAARMGHADISVTQRTYGHLIPDDDGGNFVAETLRFAVAP